MDKRQLRVFTKELMALFRVYRDLARASKKRIAGLQSYITLFERVLAKMNSKYRDLEVEFSAHGSELRLLVKAKNVKQVFEVAMKLDGIQGLGVKRFDSVTIENTEGFTRMVEQIKDAAYLSYKRGHNGSSTVLLRKARRRGMVSVDFDAESEDHPGIMLLAEYALHKVKGTVPVLEYLQGIGFLDEPDGYGEREWKKGFDPRMDDV